MLQTYAAHSFRDLLTETARTFHRAWKEFLLVALTAALAVSAARAAHAWQSQRYEDHLLEEDGVARDMDELDALLEQQRLGDTTLEKEIDNVRSRIAARLHVLTGSDVTRTAAGMTLAAILEIVNVFIMIAAFTWAIARTLDPFSHWRMNLHEASSRFWQMTALCAALFFLSLLWIPGIAILYAHVRPDPLPDTVATIQTLFVFVGYLAAVLLLPRLSLAPTITMEQHLGVREALLQSYNQTRGRWSTLLVNMLAVLAALTFLAAMVFRLLSELLHYDPALLLLPTGFVFHLSTIAFGVFLTHLSRSIFSRSQSLPRP